MALFICYNLWFLWNVRFVRLHIEYIPLELVPFTYIRIHLLSWHIKLYQYISNEINKYLLSGFHFECRAMTPMVHWSWRGERERWKGREKERNFVMKNVIVIVWIGSVCTTCIHMNVYIWTVEKAFKCNWKRNIRSHRHTHTHTYGRTYAVHNHGRLFQWEVEPSIPIYRKHNIPNLQYRNK